MAHVQHSFRLDADLSDRFVRRAEQLKKTKVAAFTEAISDWCHYFEDEANPDGIEAAEEHEG